MKLREITLQAANHEDKPTSAIVNYLEQVQERAEVRALKQFRRFAPNKAKRVKESPI